MEGLEIVVRMKWRRSEAQMEGHETGQKEELQHLVLRVMMIDEP